MARQAERTERARRRLLDAALAVFGERGFSESSLEAVARKAGVSRALIYHHFGSKDALLLALHDELHEGLFDRVRSAVSLDRAPLDNLVKGAGAFLDATADLPVARILMLDTPAVPGLREQMLERERQWSALIAGELKRAARMGVLGSVDAQMTGRVLMGALQAAAMAVVSDEDPARASRRARRSFERLVRGLAA